MFGTKGLMELAKSVGKVGIVIAIGLGHTRLATKRTLWVYPDKTLRLPWLTLLFCQALRQSSWRHRQYL